jgi:glutamate-1-semialdehyde aminotransferase
MNLKGIAAIAGRPGLFRVFKPSRTGVILETLDEKKTKLVANSNLRVSLLQEISMYTHTAEGSAPLEKIMANILEKHGAELNVGKTDMELMKFLETVLPDYDRRQVYASDVKKLVAWYKLLHTHAPEVFTTPADAEKTDEKAEE